MTIHSDNKYHKEPYDFDTLNEMREQYSIKSVFLTNFYTSLLSFIGLFLFCFIFPFIKATKDRTGIDLPTSFDNYITTLKSAWLYLLTGYVFIIVFATTLEYIRMQIDLHLGYKKVGTFVVKKVKDYISVKQIKLQGGHKLKINNSDKDYELIEVGSILEVERTATNKLLAYQLLTE